MAHHDIAQVGRPPAYVPLANTASFIFSNPFHGDSEGIRSARSNVMREHCLATIRPDKPLLIESITGALLT